MFDCCTNVPHSGAEDCFGDCNPCVKAPCHADAACTNNDGTAVCECDEGFDGDGTTCTGTINVNTENQLSYYKQT